MCESYTLHSPLMVERRSITTESPSPPHQIPKNFSPNAHLSHSLPPQLPTLPFSLRRSNAVRRSVAVTQLDERSATNSMQAIPEHTIVSEQLDDANSCRSEQSSVRTFRLPTPEQDQPRVIARYYASALTSIDQDSLARGDLNHNLKPWTLKDAILHEEARKELIPTNMYLGRDKEVHIMPHIKVTEGQTDWSHVRQLHHNFAQSRSSSAPSISPPAHTPVTRPHPHSRAASSGSYFTNHRRVVQNSSISSSRVRSPLAVEVNNYKHSDKVTFDSFLEPHRSGKGEVFRGTKDAKYEKETAATKR